jgi:uncharacterized hydrophobic protein (TIGR00341 family)
MALRLLEVFGLSEKIKDIENLLENITIYGMWQVTLPDKSYANKILVDSRQIEQAAETLEKKYSKIENFKIVILPVEAMIPRPEKEEIKEDEQKKEDRISIEEIYQHVTEDVTVTKTYFVLIVLASIVASIGIIYNNVAVIIGSMVIAPMFTPIMALSLSTTLADTKLTRKSLFTGLSGYIIAISIGVIFGLFFTINPTAQEILFRTDINLMNVLLALSAGIAGSLSFTKGVSQALVGVMVAVALLPPLVVTGLLIGSQHWIGTISSFLLFAVNLVCVNLAGVITFLFQGITPKKWWEKEKAKKIIAKAIIIWIILLVSLIVIILLYQKF